MSLREHTLSFATGIAGAAGFDIGAGIIGYALGAGTTHASAGIGGPIAALLIGSAGAGLGITVVRYTDAVQKIKFKSISCAAGVLTGIAATVFVAAETLPSPHHVYCSYNEEDIRGCLPYPLP